MLCRRRSLLLVLLALLALVLLPGTGLLVQFAYAALHRSFGWCCF